MTLLSMSYRSSVDRAPAMCSGGHGFNSCHTCGVILINSPFTSIIHVILYNINCFSVILGAKEFGRLTEYLHV